VPGDDHRRHTVAYVIGAVRPDGQQARACARREQADRRRQQRLVHQQIPAFTGYRSFHPLLPGRPRQWPGLRGSKKVAGTVPDDLPLGGINGITE
jgi:hypothetical protein